MLLTQFVRVLNIPYRLIETEAPRALGIELSWYWQAVRAGHVLLLIGWIVRNGTKAVDGLIFDVSSVVILNIFG